MSMIGKDIADTSLRREGRTYGEGLRYNKYVGKSGKIWLAADCDNPGDHLYVAANAANEKPSGRSDFQGFGGATLTFTLVDGSEQKLHAPWHSNAGAFFEDTGVDVRDQHRTRVIVGKAAMRERDGKLYYGYGVVDVLYYEPPEGAIGPFDRGTTIGQQLADELGHPVYVARSSEGGGSYGTVRPSGWQEIADRIYLGYDVNWEQAQPLVEHGYAEIVTGPTAGSGYSLTTLGNSMVSMSARAERRAA